MFSIRFLNEQYEPIATVDKTKNIVSTVTQTEQKPTNITMTKIFIKKNITPEPVQQPVVQEPVVSKPGVTIAS